MKDKWQKICAIIGVSFAAFLLESLIKYYFLNKIPKQGFYLFSNFLQIIFSPNKNLAFGLPLPPIVTIIMIMVIIIVLSYIWWESLGQNNLLHLFSISLIILGALSNLIDRLIFGYVIDYINLFFWPVFNLADAMIVLGVAIYILGEFRKKDVMPPLSL